MKNYKKNSIKFNINNMIFITHKDQIILYPTEASWGIGCNPFNQFTVNYILKTKKRSCAKGLILITSSIYKILPFLLKLTKRQYKTIIDTDHPTTWTHFFQNLPNWIIGKNKTIAFRISKHTNIFKLCNNLPYPIISTSANPTSYKAAKEFFQTKKYFFQYITHKRGRVGKIKFNSQIRNLITNKILRK